MNNSKKQPLIAVVGPTASGKTAVGAALAKLYGGEVISADSMQIYSGFDITSAKPTAEEMGGIPHHMLSIVPMNTDFSVADYCRLAREKINRIAEHNRIPVIVGGTGLYINSLIDNINFDSTSSDSAIRERLITELNAYGKEAMHKRLMETDPETAVMVSPNNTVRVIRAIEVFEVTGIKFSDYRVLNKGTHTDYSLCMIGLDYKDRQDLYDRINRRVDIMSENGMVDECRLIFENEQLKTACQAIGYKELLPYFRNEAELSVCIDRIKQNTRRYAKRQLTWFRRDDRINWIYLDNVIIFNKIIDYCEKIVAKSKII